MKVDISKITETSSEVGDDYAPRGLWKQLLIIPVEAANASVAGHIVYSTLLDASLTRVKSPSYWNETEAAALSVNYGSDRHSCVS